MAILLIVPGARAAPCRTAGRRRAPQWMRSTARYSTRYSGRFPLAPRPYDELAGPLRRGRLGGKVAHCAPQEGWGVLRQLSAIFDTRRLGYKSSLVAMQVAPDRLERVAGLVSAHPGVSHNYERRHEFKPVVHTLPCPLAPTSSPRWPRSAASAGSCAPACCRPSASSRSVCALEMVDSKKRDIAPSEPRRRIDGAKFVPTGADREFVPAAAEGPAGRGPAVPAGRRAPRHDGGRGALDAAPLRGDRRDAPLRGHPAPPRRRLLPPTA